MRFSTQTLLAVGLAQYAAAANHAVSVGEGGLVFNPDTVMAAVGDTVSFEFYPRNHSVVQSSFDKPCVPSSGGIYSGFVPSSSGGSTTFFTMTVSNSDPVWMYCSQGSHCQEGMAMVINPPSSGNTLSSYKSAASSAMTSSPTTGVTGGTLGAEGATPSGAVSSVVSAASTASEASTASTASMGTATGSATVTTTMSGTVSGSVVPTATATKTVSTAAAAVVGVSGRGEWGVLAGVVGLVFGGLLM